MALTQVGTDGVKDDAVTLAKQATGTDGQIITYDASGNPVAVGPGTDGQVLTSTGAGSPPAFEAIPTSDSIVEGNSTAEVLDTGSNGIFRFLPEGTEVFRIDKDGNVGINTNSPTAASSETTLNIYANEYPEVHLTSSVTGTAAGDGSIFTLNNDSSTIIRNQENSYIRFDTNGSNERMRIDSSGRLLIGATTEGEVNADKLTVEGSGNTGITIRSGTTSAGNIFFSDGSSGVDEYRGYVQYKQGEEWMVLGTNGATRLRVDADGLKFGSDTAAVNALSDYERGTWTPTDASGAGLTLSVTTASYVKVGDLVHVNFYLTMPSTSNTSNMIIGGLPFTQKYLNYSYLVGKINGYGDDTAVAQVEQNGTTMYFLKGTNWQTNANSSGDWILLSGTYTTG